MVYVRLTVVLLQASAVSASATASSNISATLSSSLSAPRTTSTLGGANLTFIESIVGYTTLGGPVSAGPTTGFVWSADSAITDLPLAQECWTSVVNWRPGSASWYNAEIANSTWPQTVSTSSYVELWQTSTTIYPANASTHTLCDHVPRVDAEPITQHSSWTTTLPITYTRVATPTYSVPRPCAPDNHMCRLWYYNSNIYNTSGDELVKECGLPAHMDPVNKPCLIGGGPVQLIYWPVNTTRGDLCAKNEMTILSSMTAPPQSIMTLGTTLTSGSVYVSFRSLFAYYDGFGYNDTVGPTFTDHIVPLPSTAISTHCGGWFSASGPGTALNYADLNWPVAASAYECQGRCVIPHQTTSCDLDGCHVSGLPRDPQCDTIWQDVNPILALPTEVLKIVPAWSTCSAWDDTLPNFWFDPPIALQAVNAIPTPSGPAGEASPTPASPSSTAARPAPQTTLPPAPIALPTAESAVLPSSGPRSPAGHAMPTSDVPTSSDPSAEGELLAPGLSGESAAGAAGTPTAGGSSPESNRHTAVSIPVPSRSSGSDGDSSGNSANIQDIPSMPADQATQTGAWNVAAIIASILHVTQSLENLQTASSAARVISVTVTETRPAPSQLAEVAGNTIVPIATTVIALTAPTRAGSRGIYTTTLPLPGSNAGLEVIVDGTSVSVVETLGSNTGVRTTVAVTVASEAAAASSTSTTGSGTAVSGSPAATLTNLATPSPDPAMQTSSAGRKLAAYRVALPTIMLITVWCMLRT